MKKIYIWGKSVNLQKVIDSIYLEKVNIIAVIDGNISNNEMFQGYKLILPEEMDFSAEYVIISTKVSYPEIKRKLCLMGYDEKRILCYFDQEDSNWQRIDFVNNNQRIKHLIEIQLESVLYKIRNLEYEIADRIRCNQYKFPVIESSEKCLYKIINEGRSLCRFGDGEFELMAEISRPEFQAPSKELATHLKEIIQTEYDNCIIAIANNYGSLEQYTENAQNAIRAYLSPATRKRHEEILKEDKVYYDAYVSRPYIIYKDKENAYKLFELWKQVWLDREIVVVEGEYSRNGYKNDLFDTAKSLERILCAQNNVWDQYTDIYNYIIKNIDNKKLILISLGPTATVLAYELSKLGYQALDIGQVDNEYEWFINKAEDRIDIPYKYVSECGAKGRCVVEDADKSFYCQVIKKID